MLFTNRILLKKDSPNYYSFSCNYISHFSNYSSESYRGYGYVHKLKQIERENTLIQLVIKDIEHYLDMVCVVIRGGKSSDVPFLIPYLL